MNATENFFKSTVSSKKMYDRAMKSIPSGTTRGVVFYRPYPTYATKAKGSHIWDMDGNERIDYMLNASVLVLGHSHPKVINAIKQQLENGILMGAPTELEVQLAEKIIEMVPCVEKVRFAVTGTEACMNAIRIARAYTGKNKILMFKGYYHGTSDIVVSKGGAYHSEGVPESASKHIIYLPFNLKEGLEDTIKENKNDLAAVMIEPVLGAGGGIPATKDFLEYCREVTYENDILLIFDEVQTGFRISAGGAQEKFGITPDLVALGKGVSGGLPGSAYGGIDEIIEKTCSFSDTASPIKTGQLVPAGGTHNAHPLAMASGLAHLNELKPEVFKRIDKTGESIRNGLKNLADDHKICLYPTGIGSMFHVYFSKKPINNYEDTIYSDPRLLWYFDISLLNNGVFLAPSHCSYTSAAHTDEDISKTLIAMENTLTEMKPIIKEITPSLIQ
jgi:glutamate-1-semialdehyde 2,1-aminomutase